MPYVWEILHPTRRGELAFACRFVVVVVVSMVWLALRRPWNLEVGLVGTCTED